ncbi:HipA N-terminal domain-containing protein [Limibacter armeniacum]|uniref:HipA N-terminal domain-containing protein n=1 Tax=Limibacter armeniacum TaxID=466084 RepID=UPI002FE520B5
MRKAEVYRNGVLAGILTEENRNSYRFVYEEAYFMDTQLPAISLTLPKVKREFHSPILFPFFFNMLSEGVNRKLQSLQLKMDEEDHFGLLLETAQFDTIGAVSVKPID